jgi:hypothetical protein
MVVAPRNLLPVQIVTKMVRAGATFESDP